MCCKVADYELKVQTIRIEVKIARQLAVYLIDEFKASSTHSMYASTDQQNYDE